MKISGESERICESEGFRERERSEALKADEGRKPTRLEGEKERGKKRGRSFPFCPSLSLNSQLPACLPTLTFSIQPSRASRSISRETNPGELTSESVAVVEEMKRGG